MSEIERTCQVRVWIQDDDGKPLLDTVFVAPALDEETAKRRVKRTLPSAWQPREIEASESDVRQPNNAKANIDEDGKSIYYTWRQV
jgi:hypothetical protein